MNEKLTPREQAKIRWEKRLKENSPGIVYIDGTKGLITEEDQKIWNDFIKLPKV